MKKTKQQRNNQGNAVILALMIVAVTSVIAYALIDTSTFAVRRTTQLNQTDECMQAVQAAELQASFLLYQEPGKGEMITDLDQDWAHPFEMRLAQNISVQAQLTDLQGPFNLNLIGAKGAEGAYTPEIVFSRLLVVLNIPDAQNLQQNVFNWINESEGNHEGERIYLERNPPYRASHLPFASISELNLVQGFSHTTFETLSPFISALPQSQNINVNTAPAEVLAALLNTSISAGRSLADERKVYPFANNQEFISRATTKGIAIPDSGALNDLLSVNSQYFLLKTTATCQKTNWVSYSFIKRLDDGHAKVYQRTQQL